MKKIYTIIMVLVMCALSVGAQNVVRNGNCFKSVKKTAVRDTMVTKFKYEDMAGKSYSIIVNRKTGACYVCKTSKNGKFYRQYMNKEIKSSVCKELGITPKTK